MRSLLLPVFSIVTLAGVASREGHFPHFLSLSMSRLLSEARR